MSWRRDKRSGEWVGKVAALIGEFPRFTEHAQAACIDGHGSLTGHRESGYAPGRGAFRAHCVVCERSTFYDLRVDHPTPRIFPEEPPCRVCGGTGVQTVENPGAPCEGCNGSGVGSRLSRVRR